MNISITEVKPGKALVVDNQLYMVVDAQFVKPGKGAAFVRAKLKSFKTDNTLERTFRTSDSIEEAYLEEKKLLYQYKTDDTYHFMDSETYEDLTVTAAEMGDTVNFLQDNMEVSATVFDHKIQRVSVATFIVAQIAESDPGVRGDSSKAGNKSAKIDTGATVSVPLFINVGDWVKIDTRDGRYVERVQK